jgi:hypothetical protein
MKLLAKMTLKDWKKTGKLKWEQTHVNEYSIIEIVQIGKDWTVVIVHEEFANIVNNFDRVKLFKTKQQALKYAKAYMRKH